MRENGATWMSAGLGVSQLQIRMGSPQLWALSKLSKLREPQCFHLQMGRGSLLSNTNWVLVYFNYLGDLKTQDAWAPSLEMLI